MLRWVAALARGRRAAIRTLYLYDAHYLYVTHKPVVCPNVITAWPGCHQVVTWVIWDRPHGPISRWHGGPRASQSRREGASGHWPPWGSRLPPRAHPGLL